jgi:hypothetical protein
MLRARRAARRRSAGVGARSFVNVASEPDKDVMGVARGVGLEIRAARGLGGWARRGVSTCEVRARGRRHGSGAAIGSPQEVSMSLGNGTKDGGVDEGSSVVGNETTGLVVTLARETVQIGGYFRREEVQMSVALRFRCEGHAVGGVDKGSP